VLITNRKSQIGNLIGTQIVVPLMSVIAVVLRYSAEFGSFGKTK